MGDQHAADRSRANVKTNRFVVASAAMDRSPALNEGASKVLTLQDGIVVDDRVPVYTF